MHEVIQDYLEMIYNQPHLDADSIDGKQNYCKQ